MSMWMDEPSEGSQPFYFPLPGCRRVDSAAGLINDVEQSQLNHVGPSGFLGVA